MKIRFTPMTEAELDFSLRIATLIYLEKVKLWEASQCLNMKNRWAARGT
jgi:hypothetical protein